MNLLQMSAAGAVMIAVIIVIRALTMNRVPKTTFLMLWGTVLARLLIPFSLPSGLSIYSLLARRSAQVTAAVPAAVRPMVLSGQGNLTVPQAAPTPVGTVSLWMVVWVVGLLFCAVSFTVAYRRSYREFRMSLPAEHDLTRQWLDAHPLRRRISIRQSDRVSSPLTFGILRPVILMPKKTDWEDADTLRYVLEHEFVHIQRFDALSKLLLAAAVCVHWFDPLVWVMYVLANRDMELSCDETVVRRFDSDVRAAYANALIRMEERRSGLAPLCNHFSKSAIEERITAIMKTKRITAMSLLLAAVLVAGTVTVFATSAEAEENNSQENTDVSSTIENSTLMSYVNPDDGWTYYSFDDGKTFQPMTDAEFEACFPTPNVEWWTYDEYKAWLDEEKVQLQSLLGETGRANGREFTWTQEEIDKTIAMYEDTLEDIKNGMMYSKTVDGQDDQMVIYSPADIGTSTDTADAAVFQSALELVVERVSADSGYTRELGMNTDRCRIVLTDGDQVMVDSTVVYDGLSENGKYYLFSWWWDGQTAEEAEYFRYAVPLNESAVYWRGDVQTSIFDSMIAQ